MNREAFDVNGMMVIPSDLGVTYVRKEDAISFFGLVEPSQAQQESKAILVGEVNNKYGDPEAFAERSYYIDEQVLQTVPVGYKLVAIPPAPEGE